jgi:hypothetical protein
MILTVSYKSLSRPLDSLEIYKNNNKKKYLTSHVYIEFTKYFFFIITSFAFFFFFFIFFFYFLYVHTRGGGEIRTGDLRFMRRGPQPIELPFGDITFFALNVLFCHAPVLGYKRKRELEPKKNTYT